MLISDRYSRAVHSSNLKVGSDAHHEDASSHITDTDVLGAHAFAARENRLAIALQRLFLGDGRAVHDVVKTLVDKILSKAHYDGGIAINRAEATDMARAVLAWIREGRCRICRGLGFQKLEGAPVLSDQVCLACRGTRKMPFDEHFTEEHLPLALWIRAEIEEEQGRAGPAAMRKLAEKMDLR